MRRTVLAFLLSVGASAAACSFDVTLEGRGGIAFSCTTDDDCEAGFICRPDPEDRVETRGVCLRSDSIGQGACVDADGDNAFTGPGCAVGQTIDCDDENPAVFPGATETCDGVDNNCDGLVDVLPPPTAGANPVPLTRLCPLQAGNVCNGAVSICTNGTFPVCDVEQYGPEFERVELACDGLDNNCNGIVDEGCCTPNDLRNNIPCRCRPGTVIQCGTDTGTCTRGVQVCNADSAFSSCVAASVGGACDTDDDCGDGAFCVEETLDPKEDLFDDCRLRTSTGGDAACTRKVCRALPEPTCAEGDCACTTNEDCDAGSVCALGQCLPATVARLDAEICNGLDDDCDGAIDNDVDRPRICDACPFNMTEVLYRPPNAAPGGEPCETDADCTSGARRCGANQRCEPTPPQSVCVDRYEASRPDATANAAGSDELFAVTRPGVLPWTGISFEDAQIACAGDDYLDLFRPSDSSNVPCDAQRRCAREDEQCDADNVCRVRPLVARPIPRKRLCYTYEYEQACGGLTGSARDFAYPYGDTYAAGNCFDGNLPGGIVSARPTGTASNCAFDVDYATDRESFTFDMSGNVAEWVTGTNVSVPTIVPGSFRDVDASRLTCNAAARVQDLQDVPDTADWIGFRCCVAVRRRN